MKTAVMILCGLGIVYMLGLVVRDLVMIWMAEEDLGTEQDSRSAEPLTVADLDNRIWICAWCGRAFGADHMPFCKPTTCTCSSHGICCECAARLETEEHLSVGSLNQPNIQPNKP